jgi:hypothetical protein
MNTVEERGQKQCEYYQWYQEKNCEALLKLWHVARMNENHFKGTVFSVCRGRDNSS